jgi:hypothetical protein
VRSIETWCVVFGNGFFVVLLEFVVVWCVCGDGGYNLLMRCGRKKCNLWKEEKTRCWKKKMCRAWKTRSWEEKVSRVEDKMLEEKIVARGRNNLWKKKHKMLEEKSMLCEI